MSNWVKQWSFAWFKCKHPRGTWHMIEYGMRKIKYCDDCGRCMELI